MHQSELLSCHPDVLDALQSHRPVVALESTIIAHGMPYPQNVETALSVEEVVKSTGAVPATIAILNGRIKAGLTGDEMEQLGRSGRDVIKCSRRDLPFVMARKLNGATTVAATMIIAEMAGIRMFATGGIGGVHRGAEQSFDISADLQELARTKVTVVSAGVKAILDIALTLEYLETMGVPVIGYRTNRFPAFYSRDSGFPVEWRCDTPQDIASVIDAQWKLGLTGGILVANPIPESSAMENAVIEEVIHQAVNEAHGHNIKGKDITPFLLSRITELTGGASLQSNIELVKNNARLAGEVAHVLLINQLLSN